MYALFLRLPYSGQATWSPRRPADPSLRSCPPSRTPPSISVYTYFMYHLRCLCSFRLMLLHRHVNIQECQAPLGFPGYLPAHQCCCQEPPLIVERLCAHLSFHLIADLGHHPFPIPGLVRGRFSFEPSVHQRSVPLLLSHCFSDPFLLLSASFLYSKAPLTSTVKIGPRAGVLRAVFTPAPHA